MAFHDNIMHLCHTTAWLIFDQSRRTLLIAQLTLKSMLLIRASLCALCSLMLPRHLTASTTTSWWLRCVRWT